MSHEGNDKLIDDKRDNEAPWAFYDSAWCNCREVGFKWVFVGDHVCEELDNLCNLIWHHYHCTHCGGVTQTG